MLCTAAGETLPSWLALASFSQRFLFWELVALWFPDPELFFWARRPPFHSG